MGEEPGTEMGHAQLGDRPGFRRVPGSNSQCSINTCCMNHWRDERASRLGERVMGRIWGKEPSSSLSTLQTPTLTVEPRAT